MKVLHVEAGRHLYGGARQVGLLLEGLAAAGIDNVLLCPPEQPLAHGVAGADVLPIAMGGDLDFGQAARLERTIRRARPDVVHVHSRRGADLFAGRAAARAGVPAVLTRRIESREPGAWLRRKCRRYAAIVAISRAVAAELGHAGIERTRITLIPSAADTARIVPDPNARRALGARFAIADDALVIGMCAQLVPRKGHAVLLDCLPALRSRFPQLRVLLFGRGPLEPRLRRAVSSGALDDVVTFCGYDPALPALLPGLDLLAHPAAREGLGSVVLEAMSAGRAVVAAAAGGLVDVIEDGSSGVLVPPRDRTAWLAALDGLLCDRVRRAALGHGARARVCREFSVARMTGAYISLYRSVAAPRRAA